MKHFNARFVFELCGFLCAVHAVHDNKPSRGIRPPIDTRFAVGGPRLYLRPSAVCPMRIAREQSTNAV